MAMSHLQGNQSLQTTDESHDPNATVRVQQHGVCRFETLRFFLLRTDTLRGHVCVCWNDVPRCVFSEESCSMFLQRRVSHSVDCWNFFVVATEENSSQLLPKNRTAGIRARWREIQACWRGAEQCTLRACY